MVAYHSSRTFCLLAVTAAATTLCVASAFQATSSLERLATSQQQQQQQQQQQKRQQKFKPRFINALHLSDSDDWGGPSKSAMIGGAGVNNAGEPPFEIRGFSLGNLVIAAGLLITVLSFTEYLGDSDGGLSVSGLGFVYGIPVFLAGAALKYAEIEPVPTFSSAKGEAAFEAKATETIKKIKQDVTRHRYGDEAHLDTTVKKLGLVVPGKAYPQLQELRQDATDGGELIFTMVWQSLDTPYKMWADERRVKKYETFFGPGVKAEVVKIDAEQRLVGIQLTTVSGSNTGASAKPDAAEGTVAAAAEVEAETTS